MTKIRFLLRIYGIDGVILQDAEVLSASWGTATTSRREWTYLPERPMQRPPPNSPIENNKSKNDKRHPDGAGPNLELGGTPYKYGTRTRTYFFKPIR